MNDLTPQEAVNDGGFWRLTHGDLAAVLARRDLSGEQLRVFLALADLTRGYGHERDVVSLSQIADHAGQLRRPHVARALRVLAAKGLYGQAPAQGQTFIRWVTWPPPVPATGNTTATVPTLGNSTVPIEGNGTVPKAVPALGTHQDTKKRKTGKKGAAAPPDPRIKTFIDWFSEAYQAAQRRPYIVSYGKEGRLVKRLLQSLSPDELRAATRNMLADKWGKEKASIGLLSSQINTWQGAKAGNDFQEDPIALFNGPKLAAELVEARA